MLSAVILSSLVGFVCFRVLFRRPIKIRGPLTRGPAYREWRVRYADGELSQSFNQETAENHRKVFGGEVIESADYAGRLHKID